MTCAEAALKLHDFVDGALPPSERQRLARHLQRCAPCDQAVREIRCTIRILGRLPREPMPDPMKDLLLRRLEQVTPDFPPASTSPRPPAVPQTPPQPQPGSQ